MKKIVKALIITILYAVISFIILAMINHSEGVVDYVEQTLNWVVPSTIGYFFGHLQGQTDSKEA